MISSYPMNKKVVGMALMVDRSISEKSPSSFPIINTGSVKKKCVCTAIPKSIKKKILTMDLSL
jgi:hypothetical protein